MAGRSKTTAGPQNLSLTAISLARSLAFMAICSSRLRRDGFAYRPGKGIPRIYEKTSSPSYIVIVHHWDAVEYKSAWELHKEKAQTGKCSRSMRTYSGRDPIRSDG